MGKLEISEAEVLRACCRYLDLCKGPYNLTYRRISTTGVPARVSGKRVIFRKNPAAGMADLLVFIEGMRLGGGLLPSSETLHIEVKAPGKKQSPEQVEWQLELARVGHTTYYVVRSVNDLEGVLALFGYEGVTWTTNKKSNKNSMNSGTGPRRRE